MARTRYQPEPRSVCCTECFRDPVVRKTIREEGTRGSCPWCGAVDVKTIPIGNLTEMFRELVRHYTTAMAPGTGDTLDVLLDDDWQIFGDRLIEGRGQKRTELLLAILEQGLHPKEDVDEPEYRDLFTRRESSAAELHGQWDERLDLLLKSQPDSDEDPGNHDHTEGDRDPFDYIADAVESAGLEFTVKRPHFRARIHKDRSNRALIPLTEMGAPPPERVKAARANRARQPVLYLASDEQTALSEVRAWKGAVVAVAKMKLVGPLRILNLVKVPGFRSPFEVDHLTWHLEVRALFRRFGRELSRPIIPGEEESEYRPSQHICEVVREARFDGVAYPSAMGPGHNVVLFDTETATPESVTYSRVVRPAFRVEPYPYPQMRWEESGS